MKKIIIIVFMITLISAPGVRADDQQIPEIELTNWIYDPIDKISRITIELINPSNSEICSLDLRFRLIEFQYIDHEIHSSGLSCQPLGGDLWECYHERVLFIDGRLATFEISGSGEIRFVTAIKNAECDPFDYMILAHDWMLENHFLAIVQK